MMVPELILYKIISGCVLYIKKDIADNQLDVSKSILYKILNNVKLGDFDYYQEALNLFSRGVDHQRSIEVSLFFNARRAQVPTIHISLPGESGGSFDGIGVDENYVAPTFDDDNGTYRKNYNRSFDANYNIIFTSDNTLEVLLMYHVIRAMFISIFDTVEFNGLRNPVIGGQDLQINGDLVPTHVFVRAMTFKCQYEIDVPELLEKATARDIVLGNIEIMTNI